MNKFIKNENTKKIIVMILIVLLFNFVMPTYSQAGVFLINVFSHILLFIPDKLMIGLQDIFVGDGDIQNDQGVYSIKLAPGTIFAGKIPLFDINFINPGPDNKVQKVRPVPQETTGDKTFMLKDLDLEHTEEDVNKLRGLDSIIYKFINEGILYSGTGREILITTPDTNDNVGRFETGWFDTSIEVKEMLDLIKIELKDDQNSGILDRDINNDYSENINVPPIMNVRYKEKDYKSVKLKTYEYGEWLMITEDFEGVEIEDPFIELEICTYELETTGGETFEDYYVKLLVENVTPIKYELVDTGRVIESTAKQLQNSIATWYKVLRDFALVALLSVLVYIAIRIIISSAAQEKAKYKKMLQGWFEAICILFVLQFLISLAFTGTQAITDVFSKSVVGPSGEDVLMTQTRNEIEKGITGKGEKKDFFDVAFDIVIYLVLFIYTLSFSVQYLKRVVYLAFLTMIAPVIALTYPLDKIKDGKAQAFEVWLKEFIFNVLLQPVHLLIYYLLVVNAMGLAGVDKVYALVAIGALLPAEKFIRKMFGLESSSSMGKMASALGGAAIMNTINKLGSKGSKGKSGGGSSEKPSGGNKVRMANEGAGDPYEALRGNGGAQPAQTPRTGANTNGGTGAPSPAQSPTQSPTQSPVPNPAPSPAQSPVPNPAPSPAPSPSPSPAPNPAPNPAPSRAPSPAQSPVPNPAPSPAQNTTGNNGGGSQNTNKRSIKKPGDKGRGVGKVITKYGGKVFKGIIKGTARVAGAATLGTIGLAAGIATGEIENAFAGAAGGLMAGNKLGGSLVEGGSNIIKGASKGAKGIKDTYREGKYGKEEADRMKFDEEFKKSEGYKNLMETYPGQEQTAQEFLNAGITDTKKMGKAMKNIQSGKYDVKKAIAYMKMAEKCPDKILYDDPKFANYLSVYGIDSDKAKEIRKELVTFK